MSKRIAILCFSPTNTTAAICQAIALGMGTKDAKFLDMTRPGFREEMARQADAAMAASDHLIIGSPVYFGMLPAPVSACLKSIAGRGKGATAVVVYGNRDYGISLRQMAEIISRNGFRVAAAGAFIGQHSYSDIVPVAMGRPDQADLEAAFGFGMNSAGASRGLAPEDIPAQHDFFTRSKKNMPLKPVFIPDLCIQCGLCADGCPAGILSPGTGSYRSRSAEAQCLGCMACVRRCAQQARIVKSNAVVRLVMKHILRKASKERKEPLVLFPGQS